VSSAYTAWSLWLLDAGEQAAEALADGDAEVAMEGVDTTAAASRVARLEFGSS
jgi:hypothetical protein